MLTGHKYIVDINIILVDRSDKEIRVVKSNVEINGMESIIEVRDGQDDELKSWVAHLISA